MLGIDIDRLIKHKTTLSETYEIYLSGADGPWGPDLRTAVSNDRAVQTKDVLTLHWSV